MNELNLLSRDAEMNGRQLFVGAHLDAATTDEDQELADAILNVAKLMDVTRDNLLKYGDNFELAPQGETDEEKIKRLLGAE